VGGVARLSRENPTRGRGEQGARQSRPFNSTELYGFLSIRGNGLDVDFQPFPNCYHDGF
jgi:hypothetical protein